jgi:hypothetical protein
LNSLVTDTYAIQLNARFQISQY